MRQPCLDEEEEEEGGSIARRVDGGGVCALDGALHAGASRALSLSLSPHSRLHVPICAAVSGVVCPAVLVPSASLGEPFTLRLA